jgi:hypothetical protein
MGLTRSVPLRSPSAETISLAPMAVMFGLYVTAIVVGLVFYTAVGILGY